MDPEAIFRGYVDCALWSSNNDDDEMKPMDAAYGPDDLARPTLSTMRADVADFIAGAREDVEAFADEYGDERVGHDFWLTRNGHGAGFWDRGAGELGDRLSAMARSYGESYLYVGDDGLVYVA